MGALAERTRLSKQTMTALVRLAERDGFVQRRPDAGDRRAIQVWLTPTAQALARWPPAWSTTCTAASTPRSAPRRSRPCGTPLP